MRRGLEADFDPYQMHPGEWAVSTDKKYVRMCFSPGICVRMATYEAFEKDMEQIVVILEEAKTVQEAIEKIYEEFKDAQLDIEEAKNYAILSESYAVGGTGTRDGEDTDNAKYYAESVSGAVSDIALNRQTLGYTKKNLWSHGDVSSSVAGYVLENEDLELPIGTYTISAEPMIGTSTVNSEFKFFNETGTKIVSKYLLACNTTGGRLNFTVELTEKASSISVWIDGAGELSNIQLELGDTATDYEPYVDDVNTRLENVETEVTPIERGGTGGTTAKEAQYNLLNDMNTESGYNDASLIVGAYASADAEKGILHKKTFATLWAYIKAKAETVFAKIADVTPVANLLATVAGKPLDATMGKELNDKIETLGGFTPVIDETTGKMTGYTTTIGGADTVFPFKSITHCGTYTESGSFNIADYGLSNVDVENFIFVPSAFSTYNLGLAEKYINLYSYFATRVAFKKATFTLDSDTGILTFTPAIIQSRPMTGTNERNASTPVTSSFITNELPGDIYYIG